MSTECLPPIALPPPPAWLKALIDSVVADLIEARSGRDGVTLDEVKRRLTDVLRQRLAGGRRPGPE